MEISKQVSKKVVFPSQLIEEKPFCVIPQLKEKKAKRFADIFYYSQTIQATHDAPSDLFCLFFIDLSSYNFIHIGQDENTSTTTSVLPRVARLCLPNPLRLSRTITRRVPDIREDPSREQPHSLRHLVLPSWSAVGQIDGDLGKEEESDPVLRTHGKAFSAGETGAGSAGGMEAGTCRHATSRRVNRSHETTYEYRRPEPPRHDLFSLVRRDYSRGCTSLGEGEKDHDGASDELPRERSDQCRSGRSHYRTINMDSFFSFKYLREFEPFFENCVQKNKLKSSQAGMKRLANPTCCIYNEPITILKNH